MTHSPEVRREAIERILMGETLTSVAQDLGVALGTVHEWKQNARNPDQATGEFRRLAIAAVAADATEEAIATLRELIADPAIKRDAEMVRSAAYAAEKLSNIALDWRDGRRNGSNVTIAAGNVVALPEGLTLEELRAIAAPGADVSTTPIIVNSE